MDRHTDRHGDLKTPQHFQEGRDMKFCMRTCLLPNLLVTKHHETLTSYSFFRCTCLTRATLFFFYKQWVYKHTQPEIMDFLSILLSIFPASDLPGEKFYRAT